MSAGLDPAFHDRVHSGDLDTAEYDRDACVGEDGVEQGWILAVAIAEKRATLRMLRPIELDSWLVLY